MHLVYCHAEHKCLLTAQSIKSTSIHIYFKILNSIIFIEINCAHRVIVIINSNSCSIPSCSGINT